MFHVEHPTFSTMTFFLVFSPVFQAAQERSPIAGFFLVGNCGKKRSVETAMGRREEGAGACLLACGKRKRASYVPERENMHTLLLENERRRSL